MTNGRFRRRIQALKHDRTVEVLYQYWYKYHLSLYSTPSIRVDFARQYRTSTCGTPVEWRLHPVNIQLNIHGNHPTAVPVCIQVPGE